MKNSGIPVLMYHSLAGKGVNDQGNNLSISLSAFKAQMDWLHKEGYQTISNENFMKYLREGRQPEGKWIKLTFDDGYYSWYLHAKEILAQYNFTATMFLSTAYVAGTYNIADFSFVTNDRPLTWTEIKELAASGWSVQAHGHTHPKWTYIPLDEVKKELEVCKNEIEQKLGQEVDRVAYPYGAYNVDILGHLAEEGYQAAYSVHTGKAFPRSQKLRIPRIEINSGDTMSSFQRKVETGYGSAAQALRSKLRDMLYANPLVKDFIELR